MVRRVLGGRSRRPEFVYVAVAGALGFGKMMAGAAMDGNLAETPHALYRTGFRACRAGRFI